MWRSVISPNMPESFSIIATNRSANEYSMQVQENILIEWDNPSLCFPYLFTTYAMFWMESNANGSCLQKLQAAPIFFSEEEEEGGGEGS